MGAVIPEGYVLVARQLDSSATMRFPPHVREIWLYLLRKARHQDDPRKGWVRGELFTSYKQIQDDLSWMVGYRKMAYKKHHCEIAMNMLTKADMVQTARTTRGFLVKVLNYSLYQDPDMYEKDSENATKDTREGKGTSTIHKNEKNERIQEERKEMMRGGSVPPPPPSRNQFEEFTEAVTTKNENYTQLITKLMSQGFTKETIEENLERFLSYWSEKNQQGKKRYQLEKVFEVSRRLTTWFSRAKTDIIKDQPKMFQC